MSLVMSAPPAKHNAASRRTPERHVRPAGAPQSVPRPRLHRSKSPAHSRSKSPIKPVKAKFTFSAAPIREAGWNKRKHEGRYNPFPATLAQLQEGSQQRVCSTSPTRRWVNQSPPPYTRLPQRASASPSRPTMPSFTTPTHVASVSPPRNAAHRSATASAGLSGNYSHPRSSHHHTPGSKGHTAAVRSLSEKAHARSASVSPSQRKAPVGPGAMKEAKHPRRGQRMVFKVRPAGESGGEGTEGSEEKKVGVAEAGGGVAGVQQAQPFPYLGLLAESGGAEGEEGRPFIRMLWESAALGSGRSLVQSLSPHVSDSTPYVKALLNCC